MTGFTSDEMMTIAAARALKNGGIPTERVMKVHEGRPHVLDLIQNRQVKLIINTPSAPTFLACAVSAMASAVLLEPVPATTGTRPLT